MGRILTRVVRSLGKVVGLLFGGLALLLVLWLLDLAGGDD